MKTLSLEISLEGIKLGDEDKGKSTAELFSVGLKNIILNYGQVNRGLTEEDRRKFYKISDALDAAVKAGAVSVDLEDDWLGFIKKTKRDAPMMPSDFVRRLEERIDEVKDR